MKKSFFAKLGGNIKKTAGAAGEHCKGEVKRGFGTLGGAIKSAAMNIIGDAIISIGAAMLIDALKSLVYEPLKKKIRKVCSVLNENPDDYVAQF